MLESLADELILEVFMHLRLVRKNSHEDHYESTGVEEARASFSSLCFTSKRLSTIAQPMLYCDMVTSETGEGKRPVRISQALRTLMRKPKLAYNIVYVEHMLPDCDSDECRKGCAHKSYYGSQDWKNHCASMEPVACSVWTDPDLDKWKTLLNLYPEMAQLALLLRLAPSITHIYADLFFHGTLAFVSLLAAHGKANGDHRGHDHGFKRLEKVCICSKTDYESARPPIPWFSEFAAFLQSLPLRHYAHDEGMIGFRSPMTAGFELQRVETLHLHEFCDDFILAATIIKACGMLKTLTFWPTQDYDDPDFSTIYPALLAKKDTLEHVELSVDQLSSDHIPLMGSFANFQRLKYLRIPDLVLMDKPYGYSVELIPWYEWTTFQPWHRLSTLLPASLEFLYLDGEMTHLSDKADFLWDFVNDLPQLRRLRLFGTRSMYQGPFNRLSEEFAKRGIEFEKNRDRT